MCMCVFVCVYLRTCVRVHVVWVYACSQVWVIRAASDVIELMGFSSLS